MNEQYATDPIVNMRIKSIVPCSDMSTRGEGELSTSTVLYIYNDHFCRFYLVLEFVHIYVVILSMFE